jgi:signal transduction histidine kinase
MVDRIAFNARKLQGLLTDLLDLDRISRGILEPARRPTDVGALVRRVADEAELGDRPLVVEAPPLVAEVDAPKVERIVENLLANAAKYTPEGTPVWVRVAAEGEGVLLTVEDGGPGVPEESRETIFRPFEQGEDAPRHAPGTGIGLSLVARFAELHGGRAWVEERAGGGASFRVHLPGRLVDEADEGEAALRSVSDRSGP